MAAVYILYSKMIDSYYIGSCASLETRIIEHNSGEYQKAYTKRSSDWELFYKIEDLNLMEARQIENHIKSMKSRKYIENLKSFPEISKKLIQRCGACSFR